MAFPEGRLVRQWPTPVPRNSMFDSKFWELEEDWACFYFCLFWICVQSDLAITDFVITETLLSRRLFKALSSQPHLALTDKLKCWWSRFNGNLVLHVCYSKIRLYFSWGGSGAGDLCCLPASYCSRPIQLPGASGRSGGGPKHTQFRH